MVNHPKNARYYSLMPDVLEQFNEIASLAINRQIEYNDDLKQIRNQIQYSLATYEHKDRHFVRSLDYGYFSTALPIGSLMLAALFGTVDNVTRDGMEHVKKYGIRINNKLTVLTGNPYTRDDGIVWPFNSYPGAFEVKIPEKLESSRILAAVCGTDDDFGKAKDSEFYQGTNILHVPGLLEMPPEEFTETMRHIYAELL